MKWMIDLGAPLVPGEVLDDALEKMYATHLLADGPIDRFVLLAFDAYRDDCGQTAPPPRRRSDFGSDIYSSNSLIRAACVAHPERFKGRRPQPPALPTQVGINLPNTSNRDHGERDGSTLNSPTQMSQSR